MKDQVLKVAVILGSTRPGRNGEAVSQWIYEIAKKRSDADFELVDIKDFNLPLLDEPVPPSMDQYNHGIPGALKNAIDFLFKEWNNKVAGFVSYGSAGGVRAVERLRLVMAELHVATVRSQVQLSLFTDFENFTKFKPAPYNEKSVNDMLDQVISWGSALRALRTKRRGRALKKILI